MKVKSFAVVALVAVMSLCLAVSSYCADKKEEAPKAPTTAFNVPPNPAPMNVMRNFNIVIGTVSKVDLSNPASPVIEIKNDEDGTIQKLEVMPWTSVVKISELADLKAGEPVRIMAQKGPEKIMAMSISFGKFKAIPKPPAGPMGQPVTSAARSKDSPK